MPTFSYKVHPTFRTPLSLSPFRYTFHFSIILFNSPSSAPYSSLVIIFSCILLLNFPSTSSAYARSFSHFSAPLFLSLFSPLSPLLSPDSIFLKSVLTSMSYGRVAQLWQRYQAGRQTSDVHFDRHSELLGGHKYFNI